MQRGIKLLTGDLSNAARIMLVLVLVISGCTRDKGLAIVASLEQNHDERSVMRLCGLLHDKRTAVRCAAARALGRIGLTTAVEPLIGAVEDESEYVRETAMHALGRLNDDRAIPAIARHLSSDTAVETLRRFGYARVKKKLDEGRNRLWVDHLRLMEGFGPFPPRLRALLESAPHFDFRVDYSGDSELRGPVFEKLGKYLGPALLVHPSGKGENLVVVLGVAAKAIGQNYEKRGLLYSGASLNAEVKILARGRPIYSQLINSISYPPFMISADSGYTASRTSAPIGLEISYALGPILKGLNSQLTDIASRVSNDTSKDPQERLAAVKHLAEIGSSAEVGVLLSKLNDPDLGVRVETIRALGRIGDSTAIESLLTLVRKCDGREMCGEAARSLGLVGASAAVEPLIQLLDSRKGLSSAPHGRYETDGIALTIADSLGRIGNVRSVAALARIVLDENSSPENLRSAAARSLGRIGGPDALEPLLKCARFNSGRDLVSACVDGLGEAGAEDVQRAVSTINKASNASQESQERALTRLGNRKFKVSRYTSLDRVDGWSEVADKEAIDALFGLLGEQGPGKSEARCAIVRALAATSAPDLYGFFAGKSRLIDECIGGHSKVSALTKILSPQEVRLSPQIRLDSPLADILRISLAAFDE